MTTTTATTRCAVQWDSNGFGNLELPSGERIFFDSNSLQYGVLPTARFFDEIGAHVEWARVSNGSRWGQPASHSDRLNHFGAVDLTNPQIIACRAYSARCEAYFKTEPEARRGFWSYLYGD